MKTRSQEDWEICPLLVQQVMRLNLNSGPSIFRIHNVDNYMILSKLESEGPVLSLVIFFTQTKPFPTGWLMSSV